MTSTSASLTTMGRPAASARRTPYLVLGAAWFLFAQAASMIRSIEPVFRWIMAQLLILDRIPGSSRILVEVVWAASYAAAGLLACWLVESRRSTSTGVWNRAFLAWIGIQAIFSLVGAVLLKAGVLE